MAVSLSKYSPYSSFPEDAMQPSPDPSLGLGPPSDGKEMNGGWGVGAESRARLRVSGRTAT